MKSKNHGRRTGEIPAVGQEGLRQTKDADTHGRGTKPCLNDGKSKLSLEGKDKIPDTSKKQNKLNWLYHPPEKDTSKKQDQLLTSAYQQGFSDGQQDILNKLEVEIKKYHEGWVNEWGADLLTMDFIKSLKEEAK